MLLILGELMTKLLLQKIVLITLWHGEYLESQELRYIVLEKLLGQRQYLSLLSLLNQTKKLKVYHHKNLKYKIKKQKGIGIHTNYLWRVPRYLIILLVLSCKHYVHLYGGRSKIYPYFIHAMTCLTTPMDLILLNGNQDLVRCLVVKPPQAIVWV